MLIDTMILQRHGIFEVLAESQNVAFRDGSFQRLHFVRRNGVDDIYLRAVEFEGTRWVVFDLRRLDRSFERDLQHALHRDRAGMVMFILRSLFDGADQFAPAWFRKLEASWLTRDAMPASAARPVQASVITYQAPHRRATV